MSETPTTAGAFRSGLTALKREGCAVLVVGQVPGDLLDALSARLLGDACAGGDRTRLFGLLDRTVDRARTRLSLAAGTGDCRVVTTAGNRTPAAAGDATADRVGSGDGPGGGAAFDGPATDDAAASETVAGATGTGDIAVEWVPDERQFVESLPAAVDDVVAEADPLEPAELRVCVDSLRPLVAVDAVDHRAFVETVREEMKRRRGIAHFVLPEPADCEVACALSPLFDVVVTLRTRDGPEQRWHLRNLDYRTDWEPYPHVP